MSPADNYEIDDPTFAPKHGLLRNRLGITDASELKHRQSAALSRAMGESGIWAAYRPA
jgi:hypothetical protein